MLATSIGANARSSHSLAAQPFISFCRDISLFEKLTFFYIRGILNQRTDIYFRRNNSNVYAKKVSFKNFHSFQRNNDVNANTS